MARSRKSKVHEDVDLDEVDAFDANKEKILLNEAGNYRPRNGGHEDESSDEEVMELGEESEGSDSEDPEEANGDDSQDEEEEEEEKEEEEKGWGGRQNYYGGDDASDDEDGRQMTEEAIKHQKKHLSELAMDDYVDDEMMNDWQKVTEDFEKKDDNKLQLVINEGDSDALDNLDDKEKLKLLNTSFPEFVPLLKELNALKPRLTQYQERERNHLIELKIVALSAYLSAITSYFAIFVDNLKSGETFATMKDSPVMESILQSREVWRQANELPDMPADEKTLDDTNEAFDSIEEDEISDDEEENFVDAMGDNKELQDESEESDEESDEESEEDEDREFDIDINSKRNLKLPSKKKAVVNDFTEVATPEEVDMEEKQRRKRTLRFYTSKIDQAAAKNNRERLTGDLDLPYKERLFERQQRLIEEARKRGLGEDKAQLGDDLDNEEVGSGDEQLANEINDIKDSGDDYYESMKQSKIQKQESRRKAHEDAVQAAKEGKLDELQDGLGDDGKRAVNFQILKNKGLTPHRKKDNRNSRVKKRKKYEKAQKKLKSVRQVYDSSNRGPYQGEKTGIKKGLSRSVKLV